MGAFKGARPGMEERDRLESAAAGGTDDGQNHG